jgi:homocysteine S-methyltransferase
MTTAPALPWIIDGGLATGLEALGYTMHPRLWSGGVFLEAPDAVEQLHRAYLDAGAEILITASYQLSFAGLHDEGLNEPEAAAAMRETVAVARRAVTSRGRPAMVAASIGPYGATLADGSEYRGGYGLDVDELMEFHRPRFEVLRAAGADLLAIETIPSLDEARAVARLLGRHRSTRAWVSFSCRDGTRISDGHSIAEAARLLDTASGVVAVGVNCTEPEHVASLMGEIRRETAKPIVVYPNAGGRWNAVARRFEGSADEQRFLEAAAGWARRGAWAVGGCCRVGPDLIRRLASRLKTGCSLDEGSPRT